MTPPLRAQTVFQTLQTRLGLTWIGGVNGAERVLHVTGNIGGVRCGLLSLTHPPSLQILGKEELNFLDSLDEPARNALIQRLMGPPTEAVLLCSETVQIYEHLRKAANETKTPLWHSTAALDTVLHQLDHYTHAGDPATLLHGVLVEVFTLGVLLTGRSGSGKSELALELITRGHQLIADDTPELTLVSPHVVTGRCPENIRGFLEVRGLGILNIRRMFGDHAIRHEKQVQLIVNLVPAEDVPLSLAPETRLQGTRGIRSILDVKIPEIGLPLAPGRNLAVLVECAVRDQILRLDGYHAEQDLAQRLQQEMADNPTCESS